VLLAAVVVGAGAVVPVTADAREDACDEPPSAIYVPACGAWHGVEPGVQTLAQFEATVGRPAQIFHQYLSFQSHDSAAKPFPKAAALEAIAGGRMYMFNLKPRDAAGTVYPWAGVASGVHDGELVALMDNIARWAATAGGKKVFMAFHHEPEDDVGGPYGSAADYVAAYRHVYDLAVARHVRDSLIFVWDVGGYKTRVHQWNELYPGDGYVDWLGYDAYGGLCTDTVAPTALTKSLGEGAGADVDDTGKYRFYKWATGVGAVDTDGTVSVKPGDPGKPVMLAEWATKGADGGSEAVQAQFYRDAQRLIVEQAAYSRIKAYVLWQGLDCNSFVGRPGAAQAYRDLVSTGYFNPAPPYRPDDAG
jgi:glycosyl hydrolase family 26